MHLVRQQQLGCHSDTLASGNAALAWKVTATTRHLAMHLVIHLEEKTGSSNATVALEVTAITWHLVMQY